MNKKSRGRATAQIDLDGSIFLVLVTAKLERAQGVEFIAV